MAVEASPAVPSETTEWEHGAWRELEALAERRTELIAHIQEVEAELQGYAVLASEKDRAERHGLEAYLKRLEGHLKEIEEALGVHPGNPENVPVFVQARPAAW